MPHRLLSWAQVVGPPTHALVEWDADTSTWIDFPSQPVIGLGTKTEALWANEDSIVVYCGNNVFGHYRNAAWTYEPLVLGVAIVYAMSGTAHDNVWAHCSSGIAQWDGVAWTFTAHGAIPSWVGGGVVRPGIKTFAADDTWICAGTNIIHWNGAAWGANQFLLCGVPAGFTSMESVDGIASDDVYFGALTNWAAPAGRYVHWDGVGWSLAGGTLYWNRRLWAYDASNVIASTRRNLAPVGRDLGPKTGLNLWTIESGGVGAVCTETGFIGWDLDNVFQVYYTAPTAGGVCKRSTGGTWTDIVAPNHGLHGAAIFGMSGYNLAIRAPVGGLYIDHLREEVASNEVMAINTIPESAEDQVPYDELVRLQIVCTAAEALTLTRVWITRSSDGIKVLAYDSGAGGFQAPYNGTNSSATTRSAAGSALNDELVLIIHCTNDYTSLEYVTVEAYGATASFSNTEIYTFQIEDLTAPEPESILWLTPRRALLKFNEPMNTDSTPGGSTFVGLTKGNVDVVSTSQLQLPGVTPLASWVGYWAGMSGSFYPSNNGYRPITAIDVATHRITLDTASAYGGDLILDDGIDTDDAGNIIQERDITLSISPYRISARLSDEGTSDPIYAAEQYQCAYEPFVVAAEVPNIADLPSGADTDEYVYLTFNDDISLGRLYTLQLDLVEDLYENAAVAATLDFTSPWFEHDTNRLTFWSPGIQSSPDREDDLGNTATLRKTSVVLQDILQVLWNRSDQLQFLNDPDRCPTAWINHLLYNRGNPFTFPLDTESLQRRLAAALPGFYKKIGTVVGLTDLLYTLLGIEFTIAAYSTGDYWTIGSATLGKLGFTTTLGPGSAYRRNAYEVTSPVDLTTEERRIVVDVCTWGDPATKHLHRIIEPSSPDPMDQTIWIMGSSALGSTTVLGGS